MAETSPQNAAAVQAEVEAWVEERWRPELTVREWWSQLADAGYSYAHHPKPYGRGYRRDLANAVLAGLRAKGAMGPPSGIGTNLAAPTILAHGTQHQLDRFVPRILDGSECWCQLFSEPGAGSDLAGLQTRAVRDGDEWVVSGQKVWTSGAQHSDYGILLTRTDPDRPKHQGVTYFLFPMRQPGVDVRPLREMTGHAMFNEVFLDGARVHDSLRLGDVDAGWTVANTTLGFERAAIGEAGGGFGRATPGSVAGDLDRPCRKFLNGVRTQFGQGHVSPSTVKRLLTAAAERCRLDDPTIRQAFADLHTRVQLLAWNAQRAKDGAGGRTGVEGPLAKIAMTHALHRARELGCRILGADAQLGASDAAIERWFQQLVLYSPAPSIYGGTNEIQRNIIGERGLGLPREPGPSRDTPFKDLTVNRREAGHG